MLHQIELALDNSLLQNKINDLSEKLKPTEQPTTSDNPTWNGSPQTDITLHTAMIEALRMQIRDYELKVEELEVQNSKLQEAFEEVTEEHKKISYFQNTSKAEEHQSEQEKRIVIDYQRIQAE